MTLTLNLSPELEQRLKRVADQSGTSADHVAVEILEKHLPQNDHRAELIALIQSWIDSDDVQGQKETGDYLIRVLDEDRPSERKLFPPEMKGISW